MERFIIIAINHIAEWLLGYRLFSEVYSGGYRKQRLFIMMGMANMLLLISFSDNVAVNMIINYVVLTAAVIVSTRKSLINVTFYVFIYEFAIMVAENLSLFIIRTAGVEMSTEDMSYNQLFVYTVVDKLILVMLVEIVLTISRKAISEKREYGLPNYIIIAVSVISVMILLCILVIMTGGGIDLNKAGLLTVSTALILGLNIMIYILNAVIARENRKRNQVEMDNQREKDMDNYIQLLEQKISDERILIHDVKHHLSVIKEFLDRNENPEAQKYLENLTSDRVLHSGFKYTNNSILNLLLARYDSACRDKNIEFYIDAQNSNLGFLDYADITSLICNLMDNAIEAAEKTSEPLIQLRIDYIEKTRTAVITVNNSCRHAPKKNREGSFITTKEEGELHGTGQRSILKIVGKYSGSCDSYYDEELGEFVITIILKDRDIVS